MRRRSTYGVDPSGGESEKGWIDHFAKRFASIVKQIDALDKQMDLWERDLDLQREEAEMAAYRRRPPTGYADENHRTIVEGLRSVGAFVIDTHALPGALDCLVGYAGRWVLLEIKVPERDAAHRRLTDAERRTINEAIRVGAPYAVVFNLEAALKAINFPAPPGTMRSPFERPSEREDPAHQ